MTKPTTQSRGPRRTASEIPEGFEPHFRKSPLTDPWEPLYSKRTDKAVIIGLRLAKPHTNGRGLIHGGPNTAPTRHTAGNSRLEGSGGASPAGTSGAAGGFIR